MNNTITLHIKPGADGNYTTTISFGDDILATHAISACQKCTAIIEGAIRQSISEGKPGSNNANAVYEWVIKAKITDIMPVDDNGNGSLTF